jgi:hypothetical protein
MTGMLVRKDREICINEQVFGVCSFGWWLVCSEREVLLLVADKPNEQCVNLLSYRNQITTVSTERAEPTSILTGDTREQDCLSLLLASMVGEERGEDIRVQENLYKT